MPAPLNVRHANRGVGVAFLTVAAILAIEGARLPQSFAGSLGPGFLPLVVGVCCAIGGLALIIWPGREGSETLPELPDREGATRVLLVILAFGLHVLLMGFVGYAAAAALFGFATWTVLGRFNWWMRALSAVIMAGGLYVLFALLLDVPLP